MADMSQTQLWDKLSDPAIAAGAQRERLRDNQLWLKGTDYEAQAEPGTVMIAKPETEFITEWCVMYDTERCNASTPCIKRFSRKTDPSPVSRVSSPQWQLGPPLESGWVRKNQNSEQLWPQGRDTTGYILELMELENIVANTVYLKAREGGPEGSKGRRYVYFFTSVAYTIKCLKFVDL